MIFILTLSSSATYRQQDTSLPVRVASLLTNSKIDLNEVTDTILEEIHLAVTKFDANADDKTMWIIDAYDDQSHSLLVLRRTDNGIYEAIPSPLPISSIEFDAFTGTIPLTRYEVLHMGDITGDSVPELVVLYQHNKEDYGVEGRYYILSWQGGALIDIGSDGMSFYLWQLNTSWEITNLDQDSSQEIEQLRYFTDNWSCEWLETTVFKLVENSYITQSVTAKYPDTTGCNVRLAEAAMQEHNYDQAIIFYNRANTHEEYVRIRLAIAYGMNGQPEIGLKILREVQGLAEAKNRLPELVNRLLQVYETNPTPIGLCIAAFDFFVFQPYYVWFQKTLEVGHTVDGIIFGPGMYAPPPANPAQAGCDAPSELQKLLTAAQFTTSQSPQNKLQALGVTTGSIYSDDLNDDSITDWLIWTSTIFIPPILFVSNPDGYKVSRPNVSEGYHLNDQNQLFMIQLPDETTALLNVDYSEHYVQPVLGYGLGGGPGICHEAGLLSIWAFRSGELELIHQSLLCEQLELIQIVTDKLMVRKIQGWDFSDPLEDYVPVSYVWNSSTNTYQLTSESQAALTPSPASGD